MKPGRATCIRIVLFVVSALFSFCLAMVAGAQDCGPDIIQATSAADTIFVSHYNAEKNCCTGLAVDVQVDGFVADFVEREIEPYCFCICCFNLDYDANGFAPGTYHVRVWDEFGVLYGETDVQVSGSGASPRIGTVDKGSCGVATVDDGPRAVVRSWGEIRFLYR